jgi:hypothetical protein
MIHQKLSFPATQRGCRLAWSRLVDLGSIDSGSNPGSPTSKFLGQTLFCLLLRHFMVHWAMPSRIGVNSCPFGVNEYFIRTGVSAMTSLFMTPQVVNSFSFAESVFELMGLRALMNSLNLSGCLRK